MSIEELIKKAIDLYKINKKSESKKTFISILKFDPNEFRALYFLSIIEIELKNFDLANKYIDKAIVIDPNFPQAYFAQGLIFRYLNKLNESINSFDKAINLNNNYADAYLNKGAVLHELGEVNLAIDNLKQSINLNPENPLTYLNLGCCLYSDHKIDESISNFKKAIKINPNFAEAYSNLGTALKYKGNLDGAIQNFKESINLDRNYAEANWNLSLCYLLLGDFQIGWDMYEWRWKSKYFKSKKLNFEKPSWDGSKNISNKTILIYCEQGLGDTIQFSRYINLLKPLVKKIFFLVPKKMKKLLKSLEDNKKNNIEIITDVKNTNLKFDLCCPLLSLPRLFKTDFNSIPCEIPYLKIPKKKIKKWREFIGNDGFKIGINWQGNASSIADKGRSFSKKMFKEMSEMKEVRLISVQKELQINECDNFIDNIKIEKISENFDKEDEAFLDSAAILKACDLVITSDTAIAHLSGSLGIKTWLVLQYIPDWRWMLNINYSPWYKSMKIFRQSKLDDWNSAFNEINKELKTLILSQKNFN